MSSEDEKKVLGDVMAIFGLFIVAPVGYLIMIYLFYKIIFDGENITTYPVRAKVGLLILFLGPPLCHWVCYKYCQQEFGWFKKKR